MTKRNFKTWQKVFYTFVIAFMALPFMALQVPQAAAVAAPGLCTEAVDVMFVLDASASMVGVPFSETKIATHSLLAQLGAQDRAGLVYFGNYPHMGDDVPPYGPLGHPLTSTLGDVDDAIDVLPDASHDSGTNIGDALLTAIGELDVNNIGSKQIIILVSDGQPTMPTPPGSSTNGQDIPQVDMAVTGAVNSGIEIHTFAMNPDDVQWENLMEQIAIDTGGSYVMGMPEDIDSYFSQVLPGEICDDPYCGDGITNGQEKCDGDEPLDCTDQTGYAGYQNCIAPDDPYMCTWTECNPYEYCGDGVMNGPEECDGDAGVGQGQSCTESCILEKESNPYCGDGEVNQDWEQCDTEEGCTEQCQWEQQDECSDLVLARVNVNEVENWGSGDMSSDIYLGTSDYSIPAGTWFALYWNGSYYTDSDIGSYENVPGLAVERLAGSVRAVLFGSTTSEDKEHINGNIEFYNATVIDQRDDTATNDDFSGKSNKLENDEDGSDFTVKGEMTLSAGNDEVWFEDSDDNHSYFWLTTTTADDGYYTDWSIVEDCDDIITVCKYDDSKNPLSGWQMNVQSTSNLVKNGGFEKPVVTDHSGKWELFGNDALTYWTVEWRDGGADPLLELETSLLWTPYEGNQYAELDTNAPVTIYQDIPTVVGNTYQLSFAFSPRQQVADNQLQVEFGTVDDTLVADGSSNSDNDWTVYTYTITATDTTTRLQFTDQSVADSYGTFLDDVQIFETVSGLTEENGCYEFRDLAYGDYTVTETMQDGWIQIEPQEGFFSVDFNEQNNTPTVTFVNEQEIPSGTLTICKQHDLNGDGVLDNGEPLVQDWNFYMNDVEYNSGDSCVVIEGLDYGTYNVTEEYVEGWFQTGASGNGILEVDGSITVEVGESNPVPIIYFLNVEADIWGCKYNTDTDEKLGDWQIDLYQGYYQKLDQEYELEYEPEMQWELYSSAYTENSSESHHYGCYYFFGLDDGDYRLEEVLQSGWERVSPLDPPYYEFYFGETEENPYDFFNREESGGGGPGGGGCTSGCGDDGGSSDGGGSTSSSEEPVVLGFEASFPNLEKTVNQTQVNPGAMLTYSVKVTNSGDLDMTGVVLTDTLPDGFVFADDLMQSRTWDIGVLPANSDLVFVYDVTVQDGVAAGIYANTAKLISNEFDPLITEAPVEVMPVKVLGYESLPETGGDSNAWQLALGLMLMAFGYIGFRRFSLN